MARPSARPFPSRLCRRSRAPGRPTGTPCSFPVSALSRPLNAALQGLLQWQILHMLTTAPYSCLCMSVWQLATDCWLRQPQSCIKSQGHISPASECWSRSLHRGLKSKQTHGHTHTYVCSSHAIPCIQSCFAYRWPCDRWAGGQ